MLVARDKATYAMLSDQNTARCRRLTRTLSFLKYSSKVHLHALQRHPLALVYTQRPSKDERHLAPLRFHLSIGIGGIEVTRNTENHAPIAKCDDRIKLGAAQGKLSQRIDWIPVTVSLRRNHPVVGLQLALWYANRNTLTVGIAGGHEAGDFSNTTVHEAALLQVLQEALSACSISA